MADIAYPAINDRAWVAFDATLNETFTSRVESCEGYEYVVAAPFRVPDNDERNAELVELDALPANMIFAWRVENGFAWAHAETQEVFSEDDLLLWRMKVESEPSVVQRRFFVRVPDSSEASVVIDGETYRAHLIDLSEGGTRCIVPWFNGYEELDDLTVQLEMTESVLPVPSRLVRYHIYTDGRIELAVEFNNLADKEAVIIRRHIFGRQIQNRRIDG